MHGASGERRDPGGGHEDCEGAAQLAPSWHAAQEQPGEKRALERDAVVREGNIRLGHPSVGGVPEGLSTLRKERAVEAMLGGALGGVKPSGGAAVHPPSHHPALRLSSSVLFRKQAITPPIYLLNEGRISGGWTISG